MLSSSSPFFAKEAQESGASVSVSYTLRHGTPPAHRPAPMKPPHALKGGALSEQQTEQKAVRENPSDRADSEVPDQYDLIDLVNFNDRKNAYLSIPISISHRRDRS